MNLLVIQLIGASHLLQPPLTATLARRLGLRESFDHLPPLPAQIASNMAFASVALPTGLGCLVAVFPREVGAGGGMRALAWLLSAFWVWRLARQQSLGRSFPRAWHYALSFIFLLQGPFFATFLAWGNSR